MNITYKEKLWTRRYQYLQFPKEISDVHSKRVGNISFHRRRSRRFKQNRRIKLWTPSYYCLFKKKMKRIKNNPNYRASIGNITQIYALFNNNWDSLFKIYLICLKHIL